jgi:hypothetical protein
MSDWVATIDVGTSALSGYFQMTHRIDVLAWDRPALMLYRVGSDKPSVTWLPNKPEDILRDALAMVRLYVGTGPGDDLAPSRPRKPVERKSWNDETSLQLASRVREIGSLCLRIEECNPGELGLHDALGRWLDGVDVRQVVRITGATGTETGQR